MTRLADLLIESTDEICRQLAELYCQIWLEPPWCEHDWTVEGVMSDLKRELQLPGAIGYAALDPHVVGFTWGYRVDRQRLQTISGGNMFDYLFVGGVEAFYIDELGVGASERKTGVGRLMTSELLKSVWRERYNRVILRTDDNATAAVGLYRHLGFVRQPYCDLVRPTRGYWVLERE